MWRNILTQSVNTSELTGPTLDWAVAKCEGYGWMNGNLVHPTYGLLCTQIPFSTNWAQGGPIIERMGNYCQEGSLENSHFYCSTPSVAEEWHDHPVKGTGPTPLIAAMRCYVASKLGNTVEVPKELLNV